MFFMGYYWVKKQGSIRNYFFIEIRFDINYDLNWEYVLVCTVAYSFKEMHFKSRLFWSNVLPTIWIGGYTLE